MSALPPLPDSVAAQFPFEPHVTELRSGDRMHFVDEGEGEPVLLLHGNPTWGFLWRNVIPPLARGGFRVVAPDHVGFGRSSKPASPPSVAEHVGNLTALLRDLDLRDVTLVVHDWGGPIGLAWAVRHPDRVKRVVILNTAAWPPRRKRSMTPWHAFFGSAPGGWLAVRANLLLESAMRLGVHERQRMTREVLAGYRWPMQDPNARRAALELVRSVPDGPDHPTTPLIREIEDGLKALAEKPATVLWGAADPVFPRRLADRWQASLAGVHEVKRYASGGHFLQEDVPEPLTRDLLAFLRKTA